MYVFRYCWWYLAPINIFDFFQTNKNKTQNKRFSDLPNPIFFRHVSWNTGNFFFRPDHSEGHREMLVYWLVIKVCQKYCLGWAHHFKCQSLWTCPCVAVMSSDDQRVSISGKSFDVTWKDQLKNEPSHDKNNKAAYVPREDSDQRGHPTQSDQSLRCPHEESLGP